MRTLTQNETIRWVAMEKTITGDEQWNCCNEYSIPAIKEVVGISLSIKEHLDTAHAKIPVMGKANIKMDANTRDVLSLPVSYQKAYTNKKKSLNNFSYPLNIIMGTGSFLKLDYIDAGNCKVKSGAATTITDATAANPCNIESATHGLATGDEVFISGVGGMTELNNRYFTVTRVDADNVTLDGVDSSAYTAFTTGGSIQKVIFSNYTVRILLKCIANRRATKP